MILETEERQKCLLLIALRRRLPGRATRKGLHLVTGYQVAAFAGQFMYSMQGEFN